MRAMVERVKCRPERCPGVERCGLILLVFDAECRVHTRLPLNTVRSVLRGEDGALYVYLRSRKALRIDRRIELLPFLPQMEYTPLQLWTEEEVEAFI